MCWCSSIQRKKPPEGCKSKQIEKKVMRQLLGDRGKQSKSIKSLVKCLLSHRVSTKSVSINNWEVRSLCGFRFIILRYSCVCCVDSPPARSTEKWLADRSSCHSCFSSSALKQRWWCLYDTSPGRRRGGRAGAEPMERWEERKGREVERGVVFFLKKKVRGWKTVAHWPQLDHDYGKTSWTNRTWSEKPPCPHTPPPLPEKSFSLEFAVTPAIATPVEEIICASRRVITEAECEIAVTKLCLWPHDQPETSTLLHTHYFIPPLLPLCSSLAPFIFITPSFVISLYFLFFSSSGQTYYIVCT